MMYPFDIKSSVTFRPYFGRQSYGFCTFDRTSHTHHRRPGFFLVCHGRVAQDVGISMLKPRRSDESRQLVTLSHLHWPDVSPSSKQYTHSPTCCEFWLITLSCPLLEGLKAQQESACWKAPIPKHKDRPGPITDIRVQKANPCYSVVLALRVQFSSRASLEST